ncbi:hypothetical protein ACI77O_12310 [Pseudomonas tritici]|uniref:hypothetical protein n=1 Tax=Pseudomonas tritici TaxID=2745518 RepID=UPI00387AB4FA
MAKGTRVYISAAEFEALLDAESYLSALLESADNVGNLVRAKQGLNSISEKVYAGVRASKRREQIKTALAIAEEK